MEIELQRRWLSRTSTIGSLTIEGQREPVYFTLEDVVRAGPKVAGETAIPAGRYEVVVTVSERCRANSHKLWSPSPEFLLPLLEDVPNFEGVRIHAGNRSTDTEGCILVGLGREDDAITRSRDALTTLLPTITHALTAGRVWITVKDLPPSVLA